MNLTAAERSSLDTVMPALEAAATACEHAGLKSLIVGLIWDITDITTFSRPAP